MGLTRISFAMTGQRAIIASSPTAPNRRIEVFTVGRRAGGRSILRILSEGRGPVLPRRGQAIKIVLPGGQVLIRRSAGPARPQRIIERAQAVIERTFPSAFGVKDVSTQARFDRGLRNVARAAVNAVRFFINDRTGRTSASVRARVRKV